MDDKFIYTEDRGMMDSETHKLDKQVRDYDPNLRFGQHPETKQWVVVQDMSSHAAYIKQGVKYVVVFGFGYRIPGYDEMQKMLNQSDSRRHDHLKQVEDHNRKVRQGKEKAYAERKAEAAEMLEFGYRKAGSDHAHVSTRKDGKRRTWFGKPHKH